MQKGKFDTKPFPGKIKNEILGKVRREIEKEDKQKEEERIRKVKSMKKVMDISIDSSTYLAYKYIR